MLGSLARKLRIFGFDTLYFREGGDDAVEAVAKKEKRTILTSDRELFRHSRRRGVRAYLVEGNSDRARLLSLRESGLEVGFRTTAGRASRCALCNGELRVIDRRDAAAGVPAKVRARHRLFYRCASCSRLYWHGKHWDRLRRLSHSLTKGLT